MYFPQKNSFHYNDLVLFKIEINDPYNAHVIGQTNDYCWDDKCTFPPLKGL